MTGSSFLGQISRLIATPLDCQVALNEWMRAIPFAGVFVKFDALRCQASKVQDPLSVSVDCYQISLVLRAEDALHFKASVETETHRSRKSSILLTLQRIPITQRSQ
jgi:hypothetical protein